MLNFGGVIASNRTFLCGSYVEVFQFKNQNFLKHEDIFTPEQLTWHGMNKKGGLGRCFPFPPHGPFLQVPPLVLVFGSVSAKN